jgi:tetratricopeptide (TPR) repeat protein
MTPDEWQRLKPLFERALELPPVERPAFIEEIGRQDENLASRLSDLIKSHERETASIDRPLFRFEEGLTDEQPLFPNGEVILDRFRIVRFVGRGGMGEVYEANDLQLGRVALKTIRAAVANNPQMLLRFKQEVQLARKVTSPYVCRIHELHIVPREGRREPAIFLTMEFLDGVTLAGRIAREGALPLQEVELVALQLCTALQAMHDAGVIHRDFKSNNVMLVPRNGAVQAVLTDLGLAREAVQEAAAGSGITLPGSVMGTSEYMAPEQFEGRSLTPAADIYALGVVLYELATGTRPFRASTPLAAAVRRARHLPPASSVRADLPSHWDAVIGRCLEYDPEKRYQAASEVAAALQAPPSPAAPASHAPARFWSWQRLAILLSFFAILGAIGAFLWYKNGGYVPPSAAALKWYNQGVSAIREGTYLRATHALEHALELDNNFVLAHARLAEAWAELDFTRKALEEMVRASGLDTGSKLPQNDRKYLHAVNATLTGQFPVAVQDYTAILRDLHADDKAYGLVDLGRALEKAGHVSEAQKDYELAAKMAPENPAPFMRLGILESRAAEGRSNEGEAAFAHAQNLYRASSNTEGIAEVALQRGIAANLRDDAPKAREFLEESLHAARDLDSPQLEIRNLVRMSVLDYSLGKDAKAIELANTAVDLAREKGLDTWTTEGLIRAGNAYLGLNDIAKADADLQRGLRLAGELRNPRLVALARLSLAGIRDQQGGQPDEIIALAQQALDYYKTTRFFVQKTSALILLVRARADKAEFPQALSDAAELLEAAKKANNSTILVQAEESTGGLLLNMERYPDALNHYQSALATARAIGQLMEYEAANCADALWHLGRYAEAKRMIDSIPSGEKRQPNIAVLVDRVSANLALSQRRFKEALGLAQNALKTASVSAPSEVTELQIISGLAQAEIGAPDQAKRSCQAALDSAERGGDRYMSAEARLCAARSYIAAGSPQEAMPLAKAAWQFVSLSQQKESEWRSLLYLAKASKESGDLASSPNYAKKALDILSGLENNWGNRAYQLYVSRPDIQLARRELSMLAQK